MLKTGGMEFKNHSTDLSLHSQNNVKSRNGKFKRKSIEIDAAEPEVASFCTFTHSSSLLKPGAFSSRAEEQAPHRFFTFSNL